MGRGKREKLERPIPNGGLRALRPDTLSNSRQDRERGPELSPLDHHKRPNRPETPRPDCRGDQVSRQILGEPVSSRKPDSRGFAVLARCTIRQYSFGAAFKPRHCRSIRAPRYGRAGAPITHSADRARRFLVCLPAPPRPFLASSKRSAEPPNVGCSGSPPDAQYETGSANRRG